MNQAPRALVLGLSPYHLTAREPAAFVSLLLADRVVTLVPTPPAAQEMTAARAAAQTVPRFVSLVRAWQWSVPLWHDGVIGAREGAFDPARAVHAVAGEIARRPELTPLRAFVEAHEGRDDRSWLDAVAADLLKGGADPGLLVPATEAMDRACAITGAVSVRSDSPSLASRAETRFAARRFRLALPALIEASAERLLAARDLLDEPLARVRSCVLDAFAGDAASLPDAAGVAARAFDAALPDLTAPDDDGPRARVAMVALEGVRLPAEAALRSSVAAACLATGMPAPVFDPADAGAFDALVVRVIGRPRDPYSRR